MRTTVTGAVICVIAFGACSTGWGNARDTGTLPIQWPVTTLPVTPSGMIVAPVETLGRPRPLVASSPNGPNIVELEDNPSSGASVTLFHYRNGYAGSRRLHTHSRTYRSVLIEGAMKHWDSSGSEATAPVLRPGSYWRQPGGALHADHCITERCLAFVTFEGPIDAQFPDGH